ncbi:tetratricopeptide repeat protein [Desulfovibrio mangrovi]|uniref:tetratricopeptide repeat protein n=1 Tax=Desulfovibrio mangrovi TaxID=2976983 RepID=UPI0022472D99|nr:tetratricopeptide repeat protein [Desulfovibrio mangrovi]UZP66809.1 tetratricopeptide repeat protein [Desulfovibrio mangrovi]
MCAAKEIGALNTQGMQAMGRGDYMNAEFMLHQALRKATALGAEGYTAKIQNNLALILAAQGKHPEAARLFRAALDVLERKTGGNNRLCESIRNNIEAVGDAASASPRLAA